MKRYEILKPVTLAQGRLVLNKDQSRRRAHLLKKIDGDIYEIIRKVQFKSGELIGWDGILQKGMYEFMTIYISPEEQANADAEAKAEADAKKLDSEEQEGDEDEDADSSESDLKNRVLSLHAEGKKPGEIGKALDIPHQTAAKIIREADE